MSDSSSKYEGNARPGPTARLLMRLAKLAGFATGMVGKALVNSTAATRHMGAGGRLTPLKLKKESLSSAATILALRAGAELGARLYAKPGIRANLKHVAGLMKEVEDPPESAGNAQYIREYLENNDIAPLRIGLDGLPGSGKSTLARGLAERMDMEWVCLDHQLSNEPHDFSKAKAIYEHHRLFRSQSLDNFDLLVYLNEPMEKIRRQILQRGRGAVLLELLDFEKMRQVGQKAFELTNGEVYRIPGTRIFLKARPAEGFCDRQRAIEELARLGFHDVNQLPKEALLFLLVDGEARSGIHAYHKGDAYVRELVDVVMGEIAALVRGS